MKTTRHPQVWILAEDMYEHIDAKRVLYSKRIDHLGL